MFVAKNWLRRVPHTDHLQPVYCPYVMNDDTLLGYASL